MLHNVSWCSEHAHPVKGGDMQQAWRLPARVPGPDPPERGAMPDQTEPFQEGVQAHLPS
jgi:hypothetical protein